MLTFLGKLWKFFWQLVTALRTAFFNLLFIVVLVAIIVSLAKAPNMSIPEKTALLIAPQGYLVDQQSYTPTTTDIILGNELKAETPLHELIETIAEATSDQRITAIVMDLNHFIGGGISKMEEVGQALQAFKAAGKPVYVYADGFSQQQYFLASYADKIYMTDLGSVLLNGFGLYRNYYKEAADELSLKFHVFRVGEYKDAVEPFMRNDMSDASREHNQRWLTDLWRRYSDVITRNRKLPENAIETYIESLTSAPESSSESLSNKAVLAGLVDEKAPRYAIKQSIAELVGSDEDDSDNFKSVSFNVYRHALNLSMPKQSKSIGLIVAQGTILDGNQDKGSIGSESLTKLIRQAREDESLAALIIRINSGGGSAFASEVIRQEIINTRDGGLDVYISMGSMAASGAYWLATAGDEIWATPSTLTGSIGVWGLVPNLSGSIQRLGIHSDGVGTTELADLYHIDRPLSDPAKNLIQSGVNDIYQRFISIVASARDSDPTSVEEIAGGRVWTGSTAKALGLVDELGTLHDLIRAVAAKKELKDYRIKTIEKPMSPMEEILYEVMQQVSVSLPEAATAQLQQISQLTHSRLFKSLSHISTIAARWEEGQQASTFAYCLECYAP